MLKVSTVGTTSIKFLERSLFVLDSFLLGKHRGTAKPLLHNFKLSNLAAAMRFPQLILICSVFSLSQANESATKNK